MSRSIPPPDGLLEHAEFLRALARSLLADPHQADDVVQGAYLAALERPPRPGSNLRAWLGTVTRNLAFRARRSAERRKRREAKAARPDGLASAEEVAARIELQRKMVAAVRALQEPYRSVIIHRYFDGLAPNEIACAAGIPLKTVKSRLYRALATLRAQLDREHGGDRKAWSLTLLPFVQTGGGTHAVAGSAWAGLVGLTMKKVVTLILAGVASIVLLWSSADQDAEPARSPTPSADATVGSGVHVEKPSVTEVTLPGRKTLGAFTFAGRVVDPQGAGVEGAHVALLYVASIDAGTVSITPDKVLRRERERHEAPATTTDAGGRFSIGRPYDSSSCLRVRADGFAPAFAGPVSPGAFTTIEVRPRNAVLVKVRGPQGGPLAGARVRVETHGVRDWSRGEARQVLAETTTDEGGEARLPYAETYRFRLVVDPGRADLAYVERAYDADKGDIEVTVPTVDLRTVRVLDAATGAPLPNAYMIIGSSRGTPWVHREIARRRFEAGADGVIRFPNQDGYYGRFVSAPGYELLTFDRDVMRLRRSMRIDGVVLDPGGTPVAGAPVLVGGLSSVFERAYTALPVVSAWTDGDGTFSMEIKLLAAPHYHVPDPGVRSLIALVPPHAPAIEDNIVIQPGGQATVELKAPPPASITITVTDSSGAPVPDKTVQILRTTPRAESWASVRADYGVSLLSLARRTQMKTDREGRTFLTPLPAGDYLLWLQHTKRKVSLVGGEHKQIRIVWGAGDAVFGRVVDSAGEPVARINVGLGGASSWGTQTDAEGRFRFDEVKRGDYVISVWGAGRQPLLRLPVRLNEETMIQLPAGPARLRILAAGPAWDEIEYAVTPERGLGVPSGDGFNKLDPGALTWETTPGRGILIIRAKGRGWKALAYDAAANETTEVRLELPAAGSVSGRLEEIPDARHVLIQLMPESSLPQVQGELARLLTSAIQRSLGRASKNVEPDAEGRFQCDDLSPGTYRARLLVWNDGEWTEAASAAVTVETGGTTHLRFGTPK